ncbi:MAG: LCP family protein [Oscillospiraceae bacterium]
MLFSTLFISYIVSIPYNINKTQNVNKPINSIPKQPSVNILIQITEDKNSAPMYYTIISIQPSTNKILTSTLHKQTAVFLNNNNANLIQSYSYAGNMQVIESLEKSYNIKINNYINMNFRELGEFLDNFGTINYKVFENIFIKDNFNRTVFKLDSGDKDMTGYMASNMILYSSINYDEKLILVSNILKEFILQNFKNIEEENLSKKLIKCTENLETDITTTNVFKISKSLSDIKDDYTIKQINTTGSLIDNIFYLDDLTINKLSEIS